MSGSRRRRLGRVRRLTEPRVHTAGLRWPHPSVRRGAYPHARARRSFVSAQKAVQLATGWGAGAGPSLGVLFRERPPGPLPAGVAYAAGSSLAILSTSAASVIWSTRAWRCRVTVADLDPLRSFQRHQVNVAGITPWRRATAALAAPRSTSTHNDSQNARPRRTLTNARVAVQQVSVRGSIAGRCVANGGDRSFCVTSLHDARRHRAAFAVPFPAASGGGIAAVAASLPPDGRDWRETGELLGGPWQTLMLEQRATTPVPPPVATQLHLDSGQPSS
jgi:hypothetical protein